MGTGDHHCSEGQYKICCVKTRDRHDRIIVQEKVDGSCMSVAKLNGKILALSRAGYLADTSPFEQHHLFHSWVEANWKRFDCILNNGERACGEWLALAHGTRYQLPHEPFVVFDLFEEPTKKPERRLTVDELDSRVVGRFVTPRRMFDGHVPISIEAVQAALEPSGHGALDKVEGAVWRVERRGEVNFVAKWVRSDKRDGCYLPEMNDGVSVWNWRPGEATPLPSPPPEP